MTDLEVSRRAVLAGMAMAPFAPALARAAGEGIGSITRLDPALDAVIDAAAPILVLATGYRWAEGPVWVKKGGYLLFNDVPANLCYKWQQGKGASKFLDPSGLAGPIPPEIREAGANGMAIDAAGNLVMADSGTRAIARVDLKTKKKTIVADRYFDMRFNSCNDVAIGAEGRIYFTDPPYGLRDGDASTLKEIDYSGVYHVDAAGEVGLVDNKLSRPNGIGLSPNQGLLYVSMSDEARPQILVYTLAADGTAMDEGRVFADFGAELAQKLPGLPDGLKVARSGHLFASGPGGIYVLSPEGAKLGLIATGKAIANCAFGSSDGRTLFLTSSDTLACVRLKVSGW
ncbi:MAG: SMP-30/gluconolactonase/LRE family protein [Sphingomonas sp.]